MPPQSALLRQLYLLYQVCEPRVRTQWAERKISLQTQHLDIPLAGIRFIYLRLPRQKPFEPRSGARFRLC